MVVNENLACLVRRKRAVGRSVVRLPLEAEVRACWLEVISKG